MQWHVVWEPCALRLYVKKSTIVEQHQKYKLRFVFLKFLYKFIDNS